MPRFLRVLAAPKQVFQNPGDHGLFTLLALLLFEFVLVYPSAVTTCFFRLVGAPGHALWSFLAAYYGYSISAFFACLAGGWMLYFAARAQKQQLAPWRAASALSYTWVPHLLAVCIGAVAIALGWRSPIFLQVRDVALAWGSPQWCARQALAWGPTLVWVMLAARALLNPTAASPREASSANVLAGGSSSSPSGSSPTGPTSSPVKWLSGLAALLMLAAPIATAAQVHAHWTDLRPVRMGGTLPHFQVSGLDRDDLDSDALAGRVVLLNFWATWCNPCVQEMPLLQKLHDTYQERGLALVALNIEADALTEVKTFLQSRGLTLAVYIDRHADVQERFGVHTFPTSFLIDRQGKVQQVYFAPPEEAALSAQIEALLQQ